MALYVMLGWDGPLGPALRKVHRPAHLARLESLNQAGRVVAAGPLSDGAGSLLVIDFPDQAAAERWLAEDVYVTAGVFARTEVHPFTRVFPA
jgi:uncharacterized protein YciI